jgi:hypothetical protein
MYKGDEKCLPNFSLKTVWEGTSFGDVGIHGNIMNSISFNLELSGAEWEPVSVALQ